MSRITKEIALEVAEKMVAPLKEQVAVSRKKLSDALFIVMDARVPEHIKEAHKKNPEYFDTINTVYLDGNGFSREQLRTTENFISSSGNSSVCIQPTEAESKLLYNLFTTWEKEKQDYEDLKFSIQNTLYSLKTYASVGKNFEEAVPFLPEKITTALAVPIDNIREKLNSYAQKTTGSTEKV